MHFLDLIYPGDIYCIACGRPLPSGTEAALCERCASGIKWASGRLCGKCGKILAEGNRKNLCRDCAREEHLFRKGYTCALYDGQAAEVIRDMKYREKPSYADAVAAFMAARIEAAGFALPDWGVIIPVPMYKGKKEQRGYNQAVLIARSLAKRLKIPLMEDALERSRDTGVMSSLSLGERKQNLSGALCVRHSAAKNLRDKEVLLVDDVYTTGSTADACTETLLATGCAQVDLIVFASGSDGSQDLAQDDVPDAELFYKSDDNHQIR
jgi:ComF family protein